MTAVEAQALADRANFLLMLGLLALCWFRAVRNAGRWP